MEHPLYIGIYYTRSSCKDLDSPGVRAPGRKVIGQPARQQIMANDLPVPYRTLQYFTVPYRLRLQVLACSMRGSPYSLVNVSNEHLQRQSKMIYSRRSS